MLGNWRGTEIRSLQELYRTQIYSDPGPSWIYSSFRIPVGRRLIGFLTPTLRKKRLSPFRCFVSECRDSLLSGAVPLSHLITIRMLHKYGRKASNPVGSTLVLPHATFTKNETAYAVSFFSSRSAGIRTRSRLLPKQEC